LFSVALSFNQHAMTASPKMRFLAEIVRVEAMHLQITDGRMFALPKTPERASTLRTDIDLAERTDAFLGTVNKLLLQLWSKLTRCADCATA